jgi:V/A-type H+-transporting ATPase subunit I
MVLYPEKMSRVRIIGSNSRRHSIISSIHDAGFLQLEPVDPAIEKILDRGVSGDQYRKLSTLLQKFRSYEMILPPIEVKSRMGMIPLDKLLEEAEKINIGSDLESLKDSETDIQGELKEISMRLYALDLIEGLTYDLSIYNNSFVTSYVAIAKEEKIQPELIKQRIPEASVFPLQSGNYIVSIPENLESEFGKAAADQSFDLLHIPVMSGSPSEYRSMLLDKRKNAEESLKVVRNDLMDMSKTYYEKVVQYREALEIEARKLDVSEKLSSTKNAFVMEGWIPSKRIDELKGTVDRASAGASVVSLVETDEEPPTLFNNPRRFRLFEFFVRFYSLPQSTEFDPTLIFGIIFPIFFGIMVGDWGYGLIILVGAIWLVRRIDHPRANSHIPKKTQFICPDCTWEKSIANPWKDTDSRFNTCNNSWAYVQQFLRFSTSSCNLIPDINRLLRSSYWGISTHANCYIPRVNCHTKTPSPFRLHRTGHGDLRPYPWVYK